VGDAAEKWSKAERLAVAGAVAPALRSAARETSTRRVARVDVEGNIVGYTTLAEVQKALLERHKIEIELQPDKRPKEFICERCGKPSKVPKLGVVPKRCKPCKLTTCSACGNQKPARRYYKSTLCHPCYRRQGPRKPRPQCQACGVEVVRRAKKCTACADKKEKPNLRCADCDKELSKSARWASNVRARHGKPARCTGCASKARVAAKTLESNGEDKT
jgi:hypothetical protein